MFDRQPFPYVTRSILWSGLFGLASLNMLTFSVIGIARSLGNLSDLSLTAVHRLADSLRSGALLQCSDNPMSRKVPLPHRATLYERAFTAPDYQRQSCIYKLGYSYVLRSH
jgi:hypothetical protein